MNYKLSFFLIITLKRNKCNNGVEKSQKNHKTQIGNIAKKALGAPYHHVKLAEQILQIGNKMPANGYNSAKTVDFFAHLGYSIKVYNYAQKYISKFIFQRFFQ